MCHTLHARLFSRAREYVSHVITIAYHRSLVLCVTRFAFALYPALLYSVSHVLLCVSVVCVTRFVNLLVSMWCHTGSAARPTLWASLSGRSCHTLWRATLLFFSLLARRFAPRSAHLTTVKFAWATAQTRDESWGEFMRFLQVS